MRAPWYVDIHWQARVMCKIASRLIGKSNFTEVMNEVQIKLWAKYDAYMLKMKMRTA